ncbi:hypothetical protein [Kiloniella majae]|uniref:hypothetical protein n=1 Tax=Kiloniella majae TaxID=1938558 RepID=UPI000A2787B4|nr:hypothetical protein [Kiloniella majae]
MPNIPDPLRAAGRGPRKALPSTGGHLVAQGVQQAANALGQIGSQQQQIEIDKATRLNAIQDKTKVLDQQTKWGEFELETLDTVIKREDFADLSPEALGEEYDKLYGDYIDTQIKERGFAETEMGQANSKLYREELEAKKAMALKRIEIEHERAIGVKADTVIQAQNNRLSNALTNDPTMLIEIFEVSQDNYNEVGSVTGKAAADQSAAGARGLFIRTAAQAYIDRKDWRAVDQLLDGIDPATGNEIDTTGLLTVEQTESIRGVKERAIKQDLEWAYQDLKRSVDLGQAGHSKIEEWRDNGLLTPSQWGALTSIADKRTIEQSEKQDRLAVVGLALDGDLMLDPADSEHKKGVDEITLTIMQSDQFQESSLYQQNAALAGLVMQTGILSKYTKSYIRTGMNGNSEAQIRTADLVTRLDQMPFDALQGVNEGDLAKSRLISSMIEAGIEPVSAVKRAGELSDPANQTLIEGRRTAFKDKGFNRLSSDEITDNFDPGILTDEPSLPEYLSAELLQEANGLFQRQFELTGDEDVSKDYALNQLKKVWGGSRVMGDFQLMRYPPELFYGFDGEDEWIGEQLKNDLKELDVPESAIVRLISDSQTGREATSGRPSYKLMVFDGEYKTIEGLEDKRWAPDANNVREGRERELLEEAKEKRSISLSIEENTRVMKRSVEAMEAERFKDMHPGLKEAIQ